MFSIGKINRRHENKLGRFFKDVKDNIFFHPHLFTTKEAEKIANYKGRDIYYVIEDSTTIIAYGFLRGWDDHEVDLCLGVVVKPSEQGKGYGELMCNILSTIARQYKVDRVRLHVNPDNTTALNLYKKLGYTFELKRENGDLIGFKDLRSTNR